MTFPVDDVTLDLLWISLNPGPDETRTSLFALLDLISGIDPTEDHLHQVEIADGVFEDDRNAYSPHDVIRALIEEVRRLRGP